jgi:hypothetical protein
MLVSAMTYLTKDEQELLLNILLKHENFCNGTIGHWYDSAYNIELRKAWKLTMQDHTKYQE